MSKIELTMMTLHLSPMSRWRKARQRLIEWRLNATSRSELMSLSDRGLEDIGMSRCTADFDTFKAVLDGLIGRPAIVRLRRCVGIHQNPDLLPIASTRAITLGSGLTQAS